jgi:activating signal cointegrator 1
MMLKALSLTQPWATLVALGAKRIETRSWSTPYRGPIAIHASKGFPSWARDTCDEKPFYGVLTRARVLWPAGDETLTPYASERYAALPLGAIVAIARLVEVCLTGDVLNYLGRGAAFSLGSRGSWELTTQEEAFGDYAPGRFAWLLSDVAALPKPIPCKGSLGLWTVPSEIAQQVSLAPVAENPDGEANRTTHG